MFLLYLQKASLEVLEVVVHFDIISAGSSSSVLSLTAMAEAAAQSWSSDVRLAADLYKYTIKAVCYAEVGTCGSVGKKVGL